jgi:hypothetical protein
LRVTIGPRTNGKAMTRKELRLALREMEDRGAYSLRLFLDNRTTVLAHQWFLEEDEEWKDGDGEEAPDGREGLLRVVARGRHALIAVSRIVVIEMVPFGS